VAGWRYINVSHDQLHCQLHDDITATPTERDREELYKGISVFIAWCHACRHISHMTIVCKRVHYVHYVLPPSRDLCSTDHTPCLHSRELAHCRIPASPPETALLVALARQRHAAAVIWLHISLFSFTSSCEKCQIPIVSWNCNTGTPYNENAIHDILHCIQEHHSCNSTIMCMYRTYSLRSSSLFLFSTAWRSLALPLSLNSLYFSLWEQSPKCSGSVLTALMISAHVVYADPLHHTTHTTLCAMWWSGSVCTALCHMHRVP